MSSYTDEQARLFAGFFIGRQSDYALQLSTGRYRRVGFPVSLEAIHAHLEGSCTLGTYLMDEWGMCLFAVFDADQDDGLYQLADLRRRFSRDGIPSYLEASRRGGHLWIFLDTPLSARLLRSWLLPFCPPGVEFYPKQDESEGYGSLIRVPLGVHRRSGQRYPLVIWRDGRFCPVAPTISGILAALEAVERARVPRSLFLAPGPTMPYSPRAGTPPPTSQTKTSPAISRISLTSGIAEWCARQEPFTFIGRYVRLDSRGVGHCPFPEHHRAGRDRHPSFQVFVPKRPGGSCWRCYTGDISGNVFNFLQAYHKMSAQELWTRLRRGEVL